MHRVARIMIEARSLSKAYSDLRRGEIKALDNVSFQAGPAQIYGLLGPNGAGKTTALRILSTVLEPTSGTAIVGGFDCVTQPELVRHQIGFVSANTAVYDRMTACEMVEYFGRLYGMGEEELAERIERLFDRFQMQEIRDLLGAKMSTGMKQKVSIARAIVHDPPVLIFDEATTGLDVLVARALLEAVAELRDGRQMHHFLDAHHARGRAALRPDRDHASRQDFGRGIAAGAERRTSGVGPGRAVLSIDSQTGGGAPGRGVLKCYMSWRNVKLIYAREIRDQLRDRRTLFMIAVLPLLLYPLLGMSVFQLSQFLRKNRSESRFDRHGAGDCGHGAAAARSRRTNLPRTCSTIPRRARGSNSKSPRIRRTRRWRSRRRGSS